MVRANIWHEVTKKDYSFLKLKWVKKKNRLKMIMIKKKCIFYSGKR